MASGQRRSSRFKTDQEQEDNINNMNISSEDVNEDLTVGKSSATIDDILDKAVKLSSGRIPTNSKKKGERRRMTEKEEDDVLRNDEEHNASAVTRLDIQPPNIVHGTMKPYQIAGLNWLINLYENKLSGILADEMGLGKTLQTISLIAYLRLYRSVTGPHLVVVPKSTMGNWLREFNRWCPDVDCMIFHGNKEERKDLVRERFGPEQFDVVITSYEMVLREKTEIKKKPWHMIVVDEAHRLKNECSILSQALRLLKTRGRLLITGTPLQNNLHELWALLNFLMPQLFDSSSEFDAFLDVAHADDPKELLAKLHAILRPFLLRRLKSEVAKDIPPKKETLLYVGMSSKQKEIYRSILMKDMDAIQKSTGSSKRLLNIVMQLRKSANHPYLFEGVEDRSLPAYGEHMVDNSGKMVVLDKLLKRLQERGSRVLIFSQMTRLIDILEDYCVYREYQYCRIDGSTNSEDREQQIEDYNKKNSNKFVFLLSTRAGGLGVNLQTADTVILYDSDWNPQMDLQAQDRAHRIGQTKPVNVYRLVTEHTIEEKVVERAELKLRLDAMVIQQGRLADKAAKVSKEEMAAMIRFGADEIFRSKDSTVTDEDIDLILSKGAQKTSEMTKKLESHTSGSSMLDFSLNDKDAESSAYLQLAGEGQNTASRDGNLAFLSKVSNALGKREKRSRSYDVNAYYRDVLTVEKRRRAMLPRPKRIPALSDYQFFNTNRIKELYNRELDRWSQSQDTDDLEKLPPALTEEEEKEKERLLENGFGSWTKRDFTMFLRASERYGRNDIVKIAASVTTKTLEEVTHYHSVFWQKIDTLDGHARIRSAIEKGESRLARVNEIQDVIARKLASCAVPLEDLDIKYSAVHRGKGYTEENDRYLIYQTGKLGYGEWDRLHWQIRRDPLFIFDYFFKSRSPSELNRRLDILVRLLEKDLEKKSNEFSRRSSSHHHQTTLALTPAKTLGNTADTVFTKREKSMTFESNENIHKSKKMKIDETILS